MQGAQNRKTPQRLSAARSYQPAVTGGYRWTPSPYNTILYHKSRNIQNQTVADSSHYPPKVKQGTPYWTSERTSSDDINHQNRLNRLSPSEVHRGRSRVTSDTNMKDWRCVLGALPERLEGHRLWREGLDGDAPTCSGTKLRSVYEGLWDENVKCLCNKT